MKFKKPYGYEYTFSRETCRSREIFARQVARKVAILPGSIATLTSMSRDEIDDMCRATCRAMVAILLFRKAHRLWNSMRDKSLKRSQSILQII
jgi:hypothetical protein